MNFYTNSTSIYNFMIDDTLSDILSKEFPELEPNRFRNFLRQRGCEFEDFILEKLKSKGFHIPTVSKHVSEESLKYAGKLMKQGHKILHSVPLVSHEKKVKGIVDFLVRSDSLHLFFGNVSIPRELRRKKSIYSNMYHYVPIDVKYKSVLVNEDSKLCGRKPYDYITGQVYLYAKCLEELQGCFPSRCYILARNYKFDHDTLSNLETLAEIDYESEFKHIPQKVREALDWIEKCKSQEWKPFIDRREIICKEMLPNTKSENLTWKKFKQQFAKDLGSVSQFWHCGQKQNRILFDQGILSYKKCKKLDDLQLSQKRREIVEKMFFGKSVEIPSVFEQLDNEYFVDFEIIPRIWCDDFTNSPTEVVFMIGVGWFDNKGEWYYKLFMSDNISSKEERKIMKEFVNFLPNGANLYHWGHIEETTWNKKVEQHRLNFEKDIYWNDMQTVFQTNQIVLPGFSSFKLKHVGNVFQKLGFFNLKYDADIDNGLDCVIDSMNFYKTKDQKILNELESYNEMDCKLLGYILNSCRSFKNENY